MTEVARHRGVELQPLELVLDGYELLAQTRYAAWRRRHRRDELPSAFADLLAAVIDFTDPVLSGRVDDGSWRPDRRSGE
jgi:hypothetical protein